MSTSDYRMDFRRSSAERWFLDGYSFMNASPDQEEDEITVFVDITSDGIITSTELSRMHILAAQQQRYLTTEDILLFAKNPAGTSERLLAYILSTAALFDIDLLAKYRENKQKIFFVPTLHYKLGKLDNIPDAILQRTLFRVLSNMIGTPSRKVGVHLIFDNSTWSPYERRSLT